MRLYRQSTLCSLLNCSTTVFMTWHFADNLRAYVLRMRAVDLNCVRGVAVAVIQPRAIVGFGRGYG